MIVERPRMRQWFQIPSIISAGLSCIINTFSVFLSIKEKIGNYILRHVLQQFAKKNAV